MDTAVDEVERAIEHMRPGHQDHAWADRDQAQGRAELVANRQRADHAATSAAQNGWMNTFAL